MFAKFHVHDEIGNVPTTTGGTPMTSHAVTMATGIYTLEGVSYDMQRMGLYTFKHPAWNYTLNRIAVDLANFNLYDLMSSICWNHVHGVQDENVGSWQEMSNRGIHGKWRLRCGYIAGMINWLMPQYKLRSRVLNVLTKESKNGNDDGHLIVETLHGSEWRMWDPTRSVYYRDANGKHMSTVEFINTIRNGGTMPTATLLDAAPIKFNHDRAGNLDMAIQWSTQNEETWVRRIFQTII